MRTLWITSSFQHPGAAGYGLERTSGSSQSLQFITPIGVREGLVGTGLCFQSWNSRFRVEIPSRALSPWNPGSVL